ncbi:MAG: TolC family protein, partial [Deltaproteobacteria bacterium]|nr:TolC family protein [Deltaproteobacteria bacterium]
THLRLRSTFMFKIIVVVPLALACATPSRARKTPSPTAAEAVVTDAPPPGPLDGSLPSYLRRALAASPTAEAARHRLQAARNAAVSTGTFPEPTIAYGFFASAIETRVGPQRHRIQLRQPLPWPGTLSAQDEAARLTSSAAAFSSQATTLEVGYQVRVLYWQLWLRRELQSIHRQHLALLEGLGASVRTQLEVGKATLAEASQIDLRISRLKDSIERLATEERRLIAALLAACAQPPGDAPTTQAPSLRKPLELSAVAERGGADPRERAAVERSKAAEKRAEAARLAGRPKLVVGADFIEVGPREGVGDSGKDAFVVSVGLSLPLFRDRYNGAENQSRAEARAHRALARQRSLARRAEITAALESIRDTYRRAELHQSTLLPQAETVYQASLGQYRTGRTPFANLLLAEQDLVELRIAVAEIRNQHELAWARLTWALSRPHGGPR